MLTLVLSLILGGSNPPTGSNVICCHYADDGNLVCKLPVDNPEKLRAWRDRSAAKARQRQRAREPGGESAKPRKRLRKVNKARAEKMTARYPFGMPAGDNANYLWIQHFWSALSAKGENTAYAAGADTIGVTTHSSSASTAPVGVKK